MSNELYHYGVKGMRWGIRRYQNADGSYTAAGQRRHDRYARKAAKYDRKADRTTSQFREKRYRKIADEYRAEITKKATRNIINIAEEYNQRKFKATKLNARADQEKSAKKAAKLRKKAEKLVAKTLKKEEIMQTSIYTLSTQMDEHGKDAVTKWATQVCIDMSMKSYDDGLYRYTWVDKEQLNKNIGYSAYALTAANSHRKKPE